MKSLSRVVTQKVWPVPQIAGRFRVLENSTAPDAPSTLPPPKPIGQRLVEAGALRPGDLVKALALQAREDVRLGDILISHGMVSPEAVLQVSCEQWRAETIAPLVDQPDARLVDRYTAQRCLREGILPWRRVGSVTVIATHRPEVFARQRPDLERYFGRVALAICPEADLLAAIERLRSPSLIARAETLVAPDFSCRAWGSGAPQRYLLAAVILLCTIAVLTPLGALAFLTSWAMLTLGLSVAVKIWSLGAALRHAFRAREQVFCSSRRSRLAIARLPVVSVMVPLFHEESIADKLLCRLARITYPKELLDICLVVEEADQQTRQVLSKTPLPAWARVIIVPRGTVQTKPRALNYALDFCRGAIIGVWDAEDAPAPDQIHKVVRRFHERGSDLACVQGQLDFYNTQANWLSRCFTIEYASWFRVILPGMERLGFAIPLGGTTLFFKRAVLEELGGWDAHNVTEDADLGMRLARMGYRTEMIDTTTMEEANCRLIPWIKQRSRWIKGYAITYAVHMSTPRRLWQDLGPWRFLGFQIVFLASLSQSLLAPLLWSFWLVLLGFDHPLVASVPGPMVIGTAAFFGFAEAVNMAVGLMAVHVTGRRRLMLWVPTTMMYFPMAALAAYKALWELIASPFYWDKTSHGHHDEAIDLA